MAFEKTDTFALRPEFRSDRESDNASAYDRNINIRV